ncbi:glycoside hydrolase family 127 protein [Aquimarina sp. U1-2]|uniref:beta-L-arabinofuranosidase domain-containing protein n=1 Tax=Aquimarina sp. U1-2 TaxID=2823141 RepID=UPI001AECBBE2|nr:beta-L-arabinofuranosidase domain-containing protein [Aquimarina sp. U1-2]MBP2830679.1 glycoside hydrolase family 127 protein [Aquimarina sp. U1-2]
MKKTYTFYSCIGLLFIVLIAFSCATSNPEDNNGDEVPYYGAFYKLPIHQIKPKGWLAQYLINQKNGLTGHLENAGYPFNVAGWAQKVIDSSSWWPYEQTGYWIDGMLATGYLLEDKFLIDKAKSKIYPVLHNTDKDHFIGPSYLKKKKNKHRWVHAVYFRALMNEYEVTQDPEILKKMKNFYLSQNVENFYEIRDQLTIESMLWLYQQTKDTVLYQLADNIYDKMNDVDFMDRPVTADSFLKSEPIYEHGVTYNEIAKLGAIMYLYSGDKKYLEPSMAAFANIDSFYMMVDGVNVSSEHVRTPPHSLQTHETCDIADFSWSLGYLLMATGNTNYADKIEKAMFNAAPGAVTSDFKALQYLSGPNQVILDSTSNHNKFFKGNTAMMFGPNQFTECCPGNVNRIMPNYVSRLWMKKSETNIVAAMYGPSSWSGLIHTTPITIEEHTRYPFSDEIVFDFFPEKSVNFIFTFRIPNWCEAPQVKINGVTSTQNYKSGRYYDIERDFTSGDKITISLPQKVRLSKWPTNGVAIERGPLVYALKIDENWQALEPKKENARSTKDFPAYHVTASSDWNYALAINEIDIENQVEVTHHQWNLNPWSAKNAPISIKVPAKKIDDWKIIQKDTVFYAMNVPTQNNGKTIWKERNDFEKTGNFSFTPPLPDLTITEKPNDTIFEKITLIPYGSAKLRVTIFPWWQHTQ